MHSLQERVEEERQKVVAEIKELHQFVERQEQLLLGQLAKLDQEIVRRQEENIAKILEEISSVGEQIRELEEKCQQPAYELLQVRTPGKTGGLEHHRCHQPRGQIHPKCSFKTINLRSF